MYSLSNAIATFLIAVTKHMTQSNLRDEGFTLAQFEEIPSILEEKVCLQEQEVKGHTVPTV